MGNRSIKLKKEDLIAKLIENKKAHIEEYGKAVKSFKLEVAEQLENLTKLNNEGSLDIEFKLVRPVNNSEKYDKIIEMFNWEIEEDVELTQDEFKEYVQDETHYARMASISNSTYSGKFKF